MVNARIVSRKMHGKEATSVSPSSSELESDEDSEIAMPTTSNGAVLSDVDSSDEEDCRNTIGNIPLSYYDAERHVGYDLRGRRIAKPQKATEIEQFLRRMDDPNHGRTVRDRQTGADLVLSDSELDMVNNVRGARFPSSSYDPYQPWVDWFSSEVMETPILNNEDSKRSFVPSLDEKKMVARMVHAIRMGWMKARTEKKALPAPQFYDIWAATTEEEKGRSELSRLRSHIPAPKLKLPGTEESYNPPPEHILTPEEEEKWRASGKNPALIPQRYGSLRLVPAYADFVKERYERCLDLHLAPRKRRMKLNIRAEELLPKLPQPQDLLPFPRMQAIIYRGHDAILSGLSVEPSQGQYAATGCVAGQLRVWEVNTGRCLRTVSFGEPVHSLAWCPASTLCNLVAVASGSTLYFVNVQVGDRSQRSRTDQALFDFFAARSKDAKGPDPSICEWKECDKAERARGLCLKICFSKTVRRVAWHGKGDYFTTTSPAAGSSSVFVHQLSKCQSQAPFSKSKGATQAAIFHPTRPLFFVASQRYVRVYDLLKQSLVKRLLPGCRYISSFAIHPKGDHVIVGSYDSRVLWFDLDLSTKPYMSLRQHKAATRCVAYHKHYPLFASGSDDLTAIVSHGTVYSDFQNALIVPVKILKGHAARDGMGVTCVEFHPTQPWLFTAGADGSMRLYT